MSLNFSIYTSAFNVINCNFDYKSFIDNACLFSEEVILCINKSKDDTLNQIKNYISEKQLINIRIIESDVSYSDPFLDGKLKNIALQATTNPIKIQLDLDEYIPFYQKNIWKNLANELINKENIKSFLIPVIDLYKDKEHCRAINQKWYLHKEGLFRGPVNYAKINNGQNVDINQSDTCELIDSNGNLVNYYPLIDPFLSINEKLFLIKNDNYPFVVHTGYLDIQNRIKRNKEFWADHWKIECGKNVFVPLEDTHFNEKSFLHRLKI